MLDLTIDPLGFYVFAFPIFAVYKACPGRGGGEHSCKIHAHAHTRRHEHTVCTNFGILHTARDTPRCILLVLSVFSPPAFMSMHCTRKRDA